MLEEVGNFIGQVGFPIAVAAFVLFRMNGKLERLTKAIERQTRTMLKERRRRNDLDEDEHDVLRKLEEEDL